MKRPAQKNSSVAKRARIQQAEKNSGNPKPGPAKRVTLQEAKDFICIIMCLNLDILSCIAGFLVIFGDVKKYHLCNPRDAIRFICCSKILLELGSPLINVYKKDFFSNFPEVLFFEHSWLFGFESLFKSGETLFHKHSQFYLFLQRSLEDLRCKFFDKDRLFLYGQLLPLQLNWRKLTIFQSCCEFLEAKEDVGTIMDFPVLLTMSNLWLNKNAHIGWPFVLTVVPFERFIPQYVFKNDEWKRLDMEFPSPSIIITIPVWEDYPHVEALKQNGAKCYITHTPKPFNDDNPIVSEIFNATDDELVLVPRQQFAVYCLPL